MKVDKAVCTNDNLDDLTKAVKYEAVFTTLVENKILAIKRDCEEKKKAKKEKRRSFGRILFGRRIFGGGGSGSKKSSEEGPADIETGRLDSSTSFEREGFSPQPIEHVASGSIASSVIHSTPFVEKTGAEIEIDTGPVSYNLPKMPQVDASKEDSNGSNDNGSLTGKGTRDLVVEVLTHQQGYSYDDSEKCEAPLQDKDSVVLTATDKNVDTSSLDSVRVVEDISTLAEDSLTSKGSVESLSYPSSRCTISAGVATSISYEKHRSRRRILEAKSISAQCSPILPRQNLSPTTSTMITTHPQVQAKLQSQVSYSDNHRAPNDAIRFFSRQNTSEDSANLTISTLLNEADSINALGERKSTSLLVIAEQDNKKAINRLDSNSIVSYQSNPLVRGLISSFNQLTTNSSHFPVITTTVATLPTTSGAQLPSSPSMEHPQFISSASAAVVSTTPAYDTAKLQRMTSTSTGSSVVPTGCCATKSKEKEKRTKPADWQTGQSGSDDEYRKRKRKYKRYHRCSDPVLVYPSSGGLQHCILSMPPNQPIQFHYNDDFVYDMTLQVEPDKNGDLQAIVPSQRSKRHRHHKHKKRHRHKKPKILVHDLDTQSVKVIDPDDLPQRARWTIIATACLLLVMCLMLVGITLRMAPIIDDMVRQENERLMQESMNRARFAKNFTEPASYAAAEEIP